MKSMMTPEQIRHNWDNLQDETSDPYPEEIANSVRAYCVGREIDEVAQLIGQPKDWVERQLDYAGIWDALGEGLEMSQEDVDRVVADIITRFSPTVTLRKDDDGNWIGGGKDWDEFSPCLDEYEFRGFGTEAAFRLAKAQWAADGAIEAGVIKEDMNKRNEKAIRTMFPDDEKDSFELNFQMHMARVEAVARFLDRAKMLYLRRESTRQRLAKVDDLWRFQMRRLVDQ